MGRRLPGVGAAGVELTERIRQLRTWLKRALKRDLREAASVLRLALSLAKIKLRTIAPPQLLYTVGTESKKEPQKLVGIPTGYIGPTGETARDSCVGCAWLDNGCNAHEGRRSAVLGKVARGNAGDTLENAVAKAPKAKAIRLPSIGDVGGGLTVSRAEVHRHIDFARRRRLAVLGYTHFWRRPENADLRTELMASVEATDVLTELEAADRAIDAGWVPAAVLSPERKQQVLHPETGKPRNGAHVVTPTGRKLLLCPFETPVQTRCNDCRLCDPQAKAWRIRKYHGVAFIET